MDALLQIAEVVNEDGNFTIKKISGRVYLTRYLMPHVRVQAVLSQDKWRFPSIQAEIFVCSNKQRVSIATESVSVEHLAWIYFMTHSVDGWGVAGGDRAVERMMLKSLKSLTSKAQFMEMFAGMWMLALQRDMQSRIEILQRHILAYADLLKISPHEIYEVKDRLLKNYQAVQQLS